MKPLAMCLLVWALIAPTATAQTPHSPAGVPVAISTAEVDSLLQDFRERYRLPAVAAIVVRSDSTLSLTATGVRRQGAPDPVQLTDRFHIGSNAKAMTATVIARLVEEGVLAWSTSPVDLFPEIAAAIDPAYREVTLEQILAHRGGILPFQTPGTVNEANRRWGSSGSPRAQRRGFGTWLLQQRPQGEPGTHRYSNAGYVLAAAMAEAAADQTWESLLESRLAQPLGIHISHGKPARVDPAQPWGHSPRSILGLVEIGQHARDPEGKWGRLEPFWDPAGDRALSPGDYALFLQQHLAGLKGHDGVLRASSVRYLHYESDSYAFGWGRSTFDGMPARTHFGTEGTFSAMVILLPEHDLAAAVLINSAAPAARRAARELTSTLLRMQISAWQ